MIFADMLAPAQVGDGPGDLQDAVVGAGRKPRRSVTSSIMRLPAASSSQYFFMKRGGIWALQWIFVPR